MIYRFIGSELEIVGPRGTTRLDRLGQTIELDQREGDALIASGKLLLPADEFDEAGLTEAEVKQYAHPGNRGRGVPENVDAKLMSLRVAMHERREKLGGE